KATTLIAGRPATRAAQGSYPLHNRNGWRGARTIDMRARLQHPSEFASRAYSAGRMWIVLPALLPWDWPGLGVGSGTGSGLTSDSADAVRAVLGNDLSAGPGL